MTLSDSDINSWYYCLACTVSIIHDLFDLYKSLIFPINSNNYKETDFLYFTLNEFKINNLLDISHQFSSKQIEVPGVKFIWNAPLSTNTLMYLPLALIFTLTKQMLNINNYFDQTNNNGQSIIDPKIKTKF